MRYGAGVSKWRFDELKELDRETRNSSQCIKDSTQKSMQTDLTLVERREEKN